MRIQHIIPNFAVGASERMLAEFLISQTTIKQAVDFEPEIEIKVSYISPAVDVHPVPGWAQEILVSRSTEVAFSDQKIHQLLLAQDLINEVDLEFDLTVITNSQLCIRPNFYSFLQEQFLLGVTAISIHRDTIDEKSQEIAPVELSASEKVPMDFEGFSFRPSDARFFELDDLTIVGSPVGDIFRLNMALQDETFTAMKTVPLTFYSSDSREWGEDVGVPSSEQRFHSGRRAISRLCSTFGESRVIGASKRVGLISRTLSESLFPVLVPGLAPETYERNVFLSKKIGISLGFALLALLPPLQSTRQLRQYLMRNLRGIQVGLRPQFRSYSQFKLYLVQTLRDLKRSIVRRATSPIKNTIRQ